MSLTPEKWARAEEVLHQLLERDGADRDTVLDAACSDDPALRKVVAELLAAHAATGPVDRLARSLEARHPDASLDGGGVDPTLSAALADRYRILRELGHGGTATVYLAEEVDTGRSVAIKVLRPEVAAAVGPDRFLREIRFATRFRHPHILPLLDSGDADGRLYYVMPFVEGESLRDRLRREGPLPLGEALRILREVGDALTYAHGEGVVHRDVKPGNILLDGDRALVADFGIARAITAAGDDRLTEPGLAIGTPTYMSPEQATGAETLDGRSDLYSLACVAYEMLGGDPPFTGSSPQGVLARHFRDPVPPLGTVRPTLPTGVDRVLAQALAKVPGDRFSSVEEFLDALDDAARGTAPGTTGKPRASPLVYGAVAALLVAAAWALGRGGLGPGGDPAPPLDADLVVVMPFRVSGADPSLDFLREGLLDLLSAKLTGEVGPRATDPRTLLSLWGEGERSSRDEVTRDAAMEVALRFGAGRVVLGEVVGTPSRLMIQASLLGLPDWTVRARAASEGPLDSLAVLVDRVAGQLLALDAGTGEHRLADLTTGSLPALRAYLSGEAAYRRGSYGEAFEHYERALAFDSTFALAALGQMLSVWWFDFDLELDRTLAQAWHLRDRLSPRDRAILLSFSGARYPTAPTSGELLEASRRAVEMAPDRWQAWHQYGDLLFHFGPAHGISDVPAEAAPALWRAVELDPGNVGPLVHLLELAAWAKDTASVRRYRSLYLAVDSVGQVSDFVRWRAAVALDDTEALAELRTRLEGIPVPSLARILTVSMVEGVELDQLDAVAEVLRSRTRHETPSTPRAFDVSLPLIAYALNRGRPAEGLEPTDQLRVGQSVPRMDLRLHVLHGLYWDGDPDVAADAARRLAEAGARPTRAGSGDEEARYADQCVLGQWWVRQGETEGIAEAIRALEASNNPLDGLCGALIEALLAVHEGHPDAAARVHRADTLAQFLGVPIPDHRTLPSVLPYVHLVVAQLHGELGHWEEALSAVGRRPNLWMVNALYLSSTLREEGRLASRNGDLEGAVRAYERYLSLRPDPDPRVEADVVRVRGELAALRNP